MAAIRGRTTSEAETKTGKAKTKEVTTGGETVAPEVRRTGGAKALGARIVEIDRSTKRRRFSGVNSTRRVKGVGVAAGRREKARVKVGNST